MGVTAAAAEEKVWKEAGVDVLSFPNCLGVKVRMGLTVALSHWEEMELGAEHGPSRPQISALQSDKQWQGHAMPSFLFCYPNFLLGFLTKCWGGTEAGQPGPGLGRPTGLSSTSSLLGLPRVGPTRPS